MSVSASETIMPKVIPEELPRWQNDQPAAGRAPVFAPLEKAGVGPGISVMLNIVSLVSAIGMIVILFFISQSVREVSSLEDRLAGLTQFEKRLSGQVDTVNQGFHSQFDEMNRRLSAMADQMSRLQSEIDIVSARSREIDARLQALEPALRAAATGDAGLPVEPEDRELVLSAPPPAVLVQPPAQSSEPPAPAVQFERIVSPDGKVTYSKRR